MMGSTGNGEGRVVCVTGGSGYVASWLVKLLLQRGYVVHATVRDPSDEKKTGHLLGLDGAKERLRLFKADLLEEGSFDAAIHGCVGVFHTASPVPIRFATVDPQAELIDPALKGTLNVLRSCAKVSCIRRVILTSSCAANFFTGKPLTPDVVVDESWFSDLQLLKKLKLWYCVAKTMAEKAAWEFAKENSIDLVSINPGLVIGPLLQPTLNCSVEIILNLLNGTETYQNIHFLWVDIRDVAFAHIQAFEDPSAAGRYILVAGGEYLSDILKIVHKLYPTLVLSQKGEEVLEPFHPRCKMSQMKAKTLGINYVVPLEVSLKDTIESFKEKGFLAFD